MNRILYKDVPPKIKACIKELSGDKYDEEKVGRDYDNNKALASKSAFNYDMTSEGFEFWVTVMNDQNFDTFFKKYPKKELAQYYFKIPTDVKVGDKFEVCWNKNIAGQDKTAFLNELNLKIGDIVELNEEGSSLIPYFILPDGKNMPLNWGYLKPTKSASNFKEGRFPDMNRPDEKVGTQYMAIASYRGFCEPGDKLVLIHNDGTRNPKFKNPSSGETFYLSWHKLERIPTEVKSTISESTSKKYRYKTEAEFGGGKLPSFWISDMKKYYGQELTESEVKNYKKSAAKNPRGTFVGGEDRYFNVSDVIEIETILNLNTQQHGKESHTYESFVSRIPPAVSYGATPRGTAVSCPRSKICLGS